MPAGLGEFDIIARHFAPLAAGLPGALGLLDDAALIDPGPGQTLVVTTDTVVAGVHFPHDAEPEQVAAKVLGVNLSDLAAMGAQPLAYLLAAALPAGWPVGELERWLSRLVGRLAADQATFGVALIGGDTVATPGPLSLTVTAIGAVAAGRALLRSGARVGDRIFVSGTIGDAALGLRVLAGELPALTAGDRAALLDRYHVPRPRLGLGQRLCGVATAAADVSDGLVADLGHICKASGVGATIDAERVPLSPAGAAAVANDPALLSLALHGGDDYELVFTASEAAAPDLAAIARDLDCPVTMIGRITPEAGVGERVRVLHHGTPLVVGTAGWQHFR